jgi:hypothetical protein
MCHARARIRALFGNFGKTPKDDGKYLDDRATTEDDSFTIGCALTTAFERAIYRQKPSSLRQKTMGNTPIYQNDED